MRTRPDDERQAGPFPPGTRPEPGLLVTADGEVYEGLSIGAEGAATGEAVFNTAMTGYQEILTDPSYAGQVVVMTSAHIGNYGVNPEDAQSARPCCSGLVVRSLAARPSNWRATGSLGAWLVEHRVVALAGVDTRRLTRHLRSRGAMAVAIGAGASLKELAEAAVAAPPMAGRDLASAVGTPVRYTIDARGRERAHMVVVDLGVKSSILQRLADLGLSLTVVPSATSTAEILEDGPDAVLLSNGPGDPEPLTGVVRTTRELLGRVPVLGICLGHQLLGLAVGASTFKLPFGHHGGNHPVRHLEDGRIAITAQNHGFAVDLWPLAGATPPPQRGLPGPALLPRRVETPFGTVAPTHQSLFDGSLEGLRCLDLAAASVQFHPEGGPGPHDAADLFTAFSRLIGAG